MKRDLLSSLWTQSEPPSLTPIEWEALLSQARCTRLLGRLALHLEERGWLEQVPDAPRLLLDNARRRVRRQQDETRWEADCIRRAIGHLPTPIVLLKGAAYILGELPPSRGRLFTDVDILVARDQLRAVEMALLAAGWYAAKLDPYDERYYRDWMHELPPLRHIERGTALDVHHTITPPTSRFAVNAPLLLASARPLAACPRLSVLAPADMALHSLVHLMQDGDFSGGLRDLLDLSDLLQAYGLDPAFWPELARRARELGLAVPLHHVLQQLRRLTPTRPPPEFEREIETMAPGRLRGRLMSALLAIALRPEHPDCRTAFTGLARWLLYVRSHWLRMPWYQIAPHLFRKAWVRTADRYRGKSSDTPAPGI